MDSGVTIKLKVRIECFRFFGKQSPTVVLAVDGTVVACSHFVRCNRLFFLRIATVTDD